MDLQKFWRGSSTKAPPEYIDYFLCKQFGWTPKQLDEQDAGTIDKFLFILNLEAEEQKARSKKKKPTKKFR